MLLGSGVKTCSAVGVPRDKWKSVGLAGQATQLGFQKSETNSSSQNHTKTKS